MAKLNKQQINKQTIEEKHEINNEYKIKCKKLQWHNNEHSILGFNDKSINKQFKRSIKLRK